MQECRTDWVSVCQEQLLPHSHIITYTNPCIVYLANVYLFWQHTSCCNTSRHVFCLFEKDKEETYWYTTCDFQCNFTVWIRNRENTQHCLLVLKCRNEKLTTGNLWEVEQVFLQILGNSRCWGGVDISVVHHDNGWSTINTYVLHMAGYWVRLSGWESIWQTDFRQNILSHNVLRFTLSERLHVTSHSL